MCRNKTYEDAENLSLACSRVFVLVSNPAQHSCSKKIRCRQWRVVHLTPTSYAKAFLCSSNMIVSSTVNSLSKRGPGGSQEIPTMFSGRMKPWQFQHETFPNASLFLLTCAVFEPMMFVAPVMEIRFQSRYSSNVSSKWGFNIRTEVIRRSLKHRASRMPGKISRTESLS